MKNYIALCGITLAALVLAPAMQAAAIVEATNNNNCIVVANADCEGVAFDFNSLGNPLLGNTAHAQVAFASTDVTLTGEPGGTISAVSGGFKNLTISVPGFYFAELLFRITPAVATSVTITAYDAVGVPATETFDLAVTGVERFRVMATGNELIRSVTLDSIDPMTDVRQVKIGGFESAAVPEPATVLILGSGLVALGFVRRHKRVK